MCLFVKLLPLLIKCIHDNKKMLKPNKMARERERSLQVLFAHVFFCLNDNSHRMHFNFECCCVQAMFSKHKHTHKHIVFHPENLPKLFSSQNDHASIVPQ